MEWNNGEDLLATHEIFSVRSHEESRIEELHLIAFNLNLAREELVPIMQSKACL